MRRFGPWEVVSELGQGGAGAVYLVEHAETGRQAALKTVLGEDPRGEASLRREIRALHELDHPGIVRLVGAGLVDRPPWYAMAYVEGARTLREHAIVELKLAATSGRALSTQAGWVRTMTSVQGAGADGDRHGADGGLREELDPDALVAVLRMVARLCRPLAYLHGQGLVHRDLKPDNVLVSRDGHVILVDFGLLARFSGGFGREQLDVSGIRSGTASYMSPEQIRGDWPDARTDLYAVGCILYELLVGTPPFGGNTAAVLHGHLLERPVRPSERVSGVPEAVDDLVVALLAKERANRPAYAADVERELAGAAGDPLPTPPPAAYYLYRPRLTGRAEAMQRLEGALADAEAGQRRIVLLTGESGVGKTSLAAELARRAALRGDRVITGHGGPHADAGGGAPFHPLRGVARAALDEVRDDPAFLPPVTIRIIEAVDPRFRGLIGARTPALAELPPEAARARMYLAAIEILRALSARKPLVLVLDDLQWADELTLGMLAFLGEQVEDLPVLVVGTCRTEGLQAVERVGGKRIRVSRLGEDHVATIAADMLALDEPPARLGRFLSRQSAGNPFYVAEFLRAAIADRVLWRDVGKGWSLSPPGSVGPVDYDELALPGSMRALVERRLTLLPWNARKLVGAAAVLGRRVPLGILGETADLAEGLFLGAVATLLQLSVLEEAGPDTLRFVHDTVREVAYERLGAAERRDLHRRTALALEADSDRWADQLQDLARHWERAEDRPRALRTYLAAGRVALSRHAHAEAERCYMAALRLAEGPAERVAPLLELAGELFWVAGRFAEARNAALGGVEAARAIGDRQAEALGLVWFGRAEHVLGRLDETVRLCLVARELAQSIGDERIAGLATARVASVHHVRGDHHAAAALYEEALGLHRAAGDRRAQGETAGNLALLVAEQVGDYERALPLYEEALAIHRQVGNRRAEGHVLGNIASLHHSRGELDRAGEMYEKARSILIEVSDRPFEAIALSNIALLDRDAGRLDDAERRLGEALAMHEELDNLQVAAAVRCELADLLRLARGDFDGAKACLDAAMQVFVDLDDVRYQGITHCRLAAVALATGQDPTAHVDAARAIRDVIDASPNSELGEELIQLERALGGEDVFRGSWLGGLADGLRGWLEASVRTP